MINLINKVAVAVAVLLGLLFWLPNVALAEQTCTEVYGGGVVCGESTPKEEVVHEPVEAGVADNPFVFGTVLILASGVFYSFSRKLQVKQPNFIK